MHEKVVFLLFLWFNWDAAASLALQGSFKSRIDYHKLNFLQPYAE